MVCFKKKATTGLSDRVRTYAISNRGNFILCKSSTRQQRLLFLPSHLAFELLTCILNMHSLSTQKKV